MSKKEYLEKLENLIINRIKYHAPNLSNDDIDFSLLDAYGINPTYPIFIFKKPLDKMFFKVFFDVKKKIKFNLIIFGEVLIKNNKFSKLDMTYVLNKEEIGSKLYNSLMAMNINYLSHTNFKRDGEDEYLKINGKKINYDYLPYFFNKKYMENGVIIEAKKFLLNGKNEYLTFTNIRDDVNVIDVDINIPLPRGYYFFNRGKNCVEVKNLTNLDKVYFNFSARQSEITFSNMEGIESCTFACVHLKAKVVLMPKEIQSIFFNFGDKKFTLANKRDMQNYFNIAQSKMNEIFDLKVTTHDKKFDELFNLSLPRKIWEKWQNFDFDEASENEWIKLKENLIKTTEKGVQINNQFNGVKELKFFRNYRWKRVFILHNNSCYMYADKIKYFNFTLLTKQIFDKNNEIYLSFDS